MESKKQVFALCVSTFVVITLLFSGETAQSAQVYLYNGKTNSHSFSVHFPSDWKPMLYNDQEQAFIPQRYEGKAFMQIREFEGYTYSQAMNYYVNDEVSLLEFEDVVIKNSEDLIGKKAYYKNRTDDKEFTITFIKRGTVILALTSKVPEKKYEEGSALIHNTIHFTDQWRQYIDYQKGYSLIVPEIFSIQNHENGVYISTAADDQVIFSVAVLEKVKLKKAPHKVRGENEELDEVEEFSFQKEYPALRAMYEDEESGQKFRRIFVETGTRILVLSDVNVEHNFPHLDIYDEYVTEMIASVQSFDLKGDHESYLYFPDVRNSHPNVEAINELKRKEILSGYKDGSFQPERTLNRAEFAKIIVSTRGTPSSLYYSNCFKDVAEQWYAPSICYAKKRGWVNGYEDGTFRPDDLINRAEAVKIVMEVFFESRMAKEKLPVTTAAADIQTTSWYGSYYIFADKFQLLDMRHMSNEKGKPLFRPDDPITRQEVAEMIYRSYNLK